MQTDLSPDKGWYPLKTHNLKWIGLISVDNDWSTFGVPPCEPGEARQALRRPMPVGGPDAPWASASLSKQPCCAIVKLTSLRHNRRTPWSVDKDSDMETKLYVGNLPYTATEEELQAMFASAGTVKTVTVVRDRDTGRSRGFAFVEMETQADAQKAISMVNGKDLGGRALTVNMARPREERSGGRPGGSRGRSGGSRDRDY